MIYYYYDKSLIVIIILISMIIIIIIIIKFVYLPQQVEEDVYRAWSKFPEISNSSTTSNKFFTCLFKIHSTHFQFLFSGVQLIIFDYII